MEAVLARGARGAAVEALQKALAALGVNPGPIDGVFGSGTEAAVKLFQTKAGLDADGIVGPRTRSALTARLKIAAKAAFKVAAPAPRPVPKGAALRTAMAKQSPKAAPGAAGARALASAGTKIPAKKKKG